MNARSTSMRAAGRGDVVQCARCGHACAVAAWRAMPPQHALGRADLAGVVTEWPAGVTVEVRACAACGRPIARVVATDAATAA
jgi:hypothetical protein